MPVASVLTNLLDNPRIAWSGPLPASPAWATSRRCMPVPLRAKGTLSSTTGWPGADRGSQLTARAPLRAATLSRVPAGRRALRGRDCARVLHERLGRARSWRCSPRVGRGPSGSSPPAGISYWIRYRARVRAARSQRRRSDGPVGAVAQRVAQPWRRGRELAVDECLRIAGRARTELSRARWTRPSRSSLIASTSPSWRVSAARSVSVRSSWTSRPPSVEESRVRCDQVRVAAASEATLPRRRQPLERGCGPVSRRSVNSIARASRSSSRWRAPCVGSAASCARSRSSRSLQLARAVPALGAARAARRARAASSCGGPARLRELRVIGASRGGELVDREILVVALEHPPSRRAPAPRSGSTGLAGACWGRRPRARRLPASSSRTSSRGLAAGARERGVGPPRA